MVPDKYVFTLLVHCASNLPIVDPDGKLPSPFVACKTTVDVKNKMPAKAATVAAVETRYP